MRFHCNSPLSPSWQHVWRNNLSLPPACSQCLSHLSPSSGNFRIRNSAILTPVSLLFFLQYSRRQTLPPPLYMGKSNHPNGFLDGASSPSDFPMLDSQGLNTVSKLTAMAQIACRQLQAEDVGIPANLLQDLQQQQQQPFIKVPGDEASWQHRRCFAKPALPALLRTLEGWKASGERIPPPRAFENQSVMGVVEILPHNWNQIQTQYNVFRTAVLDQSPLETIQSSLQELLAALTKTGILYLLGHRSTVGSSGSLCPAVPLLLQAFQQKHSAHSELTVGGRALTKHAHRSRVWWPHPRGNCATKNQMALDCVQEILQHAAWVNVHVVPLGNQQQQPIVEIRQTEGYGARWTCSEPVTFRGFLEPVSPFYQPEEEEDDDDSDDNDDDDEPT